MARTHSINRHARRVTSTGVRVTTVVRPPPRDQTVALGGAVARHESDRAAGVGVEPVCVLSRAALLHLSWLELVRDSATQPLPLRLARQALAVTVRAGARARPVHPFTVRLACWCAAVPATAWLVLAMVRPDASWGT